MPAPKSKYTYFYILDHLGSTSMVLDADGNILQSVTYVPYGEIFVEERNGTWNTPYLFNGKALLSWAPPSALMPHRTKLAPTGQKH